MKRDIRIVSPADEFFIASAQESTGFSVPRPFTEGAELDLPHYTVVEPSGRRVFYIHPPLYDRAVLGFVNAAGVLINLNSVLKAAFNNCSADVHGTLRQGRVHNALDHEGCKRINGKEYLPILRSAWDDYQDCVFNPIKYALTIMDVLRGRGSKPDNDSRQAARLLLDHGYGPQKPKWPVPYKKTNLQLIAGVIDVPATEVTPPLLGK